MGKVDGVYRQFMFVDLHFLYVALLTAFPLVILLWYQFPQSCVSVKPPITDHDPSKSAVLVYDLPIFHLCTYRWAFLWR